MSSLIIIDDDGNDTFTKILLHMDGANDGTVFTDTAVGATGTHTWAFGGGTGFLDRARTSTANQKFGTASLLVPTGIAFIGTTDHADFTLGALDWAVDFWVNRNGTTGARSLFGQSLNGGAANTTIAANFTAGDDINFYVSDGSSLGTFSTGDTITGSAWHHVAFERYGNALTAYIDGVVTSGINGAAFSGTVPDVTSGFSVGRLGESTAVPDYIGYLDEFRLSVGIARYRGAHTPRSFAYGPG